MARRALLIYDGDCAFCTRCAQWAQERIDFRAIPWEDAELDTLGLTRTDVERSVWLLDGDQVESGADAVATLLQRARTFRWRFAGELLALPGVRQLARPAYGLVARNRHRLPGATAACVVP